MKKKSYMLLCLAALLGFTACSSDDDWAGGQPGSGKEVVVKAAIGHNRLFTKTLPESDDALDQAKFTEGDSIRINDGTKDIDYVLKNDKWEPATAGEVLTWDKGNMTFNAFFPSNVEGNTFTEGSVQLDQSTKEALVKSDYMTATKTVAEADDHTLNLTFERKTARVVVEIVGYNDQFNATDNPVTSVSVQGAIDTKDNKDIVKAYNVTTAGQDGGGTKFVALLFPTTADANTVFILLDMKDGDYTKILSITGIPQLEAGNSYTVKVTVGKNQAKVESVTVTPWTEGSLIPGGEATDKPAKIKGVRLGTDVTDNDALEAWLNENIGDETGYTVALTGAWSDTYKEAIRIFTQEHSDADLTVDLSGVTGLTSIPDNAFSSSGIASLASKGLTGMVLPSTVTSIGSSAFKWTGLKSIEIPEGLTSIGSSAFDGTAIETLTLPASLVAVGDEAFYAMEELKEIRFKGNVTSFGNNLFCYDSNLSSIYLNYCTFSPPTITESTFSNLNLNGDQNITVYAMDNWRLANFRTNYAWNTVKGLKFTFAIAP